MGRKVEIVPYTHAWRADFDRLAAFLRQHPMLADVRIEHVGSTSVEGLPAKPIIDLDLIATDRTQVGVQIAALQALGYQHRGDLGITDREAFYPPQDKGLPAHNLYVCIEGSVALQNHLLLRDFLRENEAWRQKYAVVKMDLAQRYPDNVDKYCESKSDFIIELLRQCGMGQDDLATILEQNTL